MDNNSIITIIIALFGGGISVLMYKFFFPKTNATNKVVTKAAEERKADSEKIDAAEAKVVAMDEDLNVKLKELAKDTNAKDVTLQKIAETLKKVEARKSIPENEIKSEYAKHGFKVEDF